MQDLLCGQNIYAIKVDGLTQLFFLIGMQVTRKCVRDYLCVYTTQTGLGPKLCMITK
jgi:hypothetical protein